MIILYGYIITLAMDLALSESTDVTVQCALCNQGIAGRSLKIIYSINNLDFGNLEVTYNGSPMKVTPYMFKNNVPVTNIKDSRLSVHQQQIGDTAQLNITLTGLRLEDNGKAFSYKYVDKTAGTFSKADDVIVYDVIVYAPPKFCEPPKKAYEIEEMKEKNIEFALCGNPIPTITAVVGAIPVKVFKVNVSNTGVQSQYRYNYRAELIMKKEQCGHFLNITATSSRFGHESFKSTLKLLFQPDKVTRVNVQLYEENNLNVTWQEIRQYGSCMVEYNVKRVADGGNPEILKAKNEKFVIFYDVYGNNSISVGAEVNGRMGDYSDPEFESILRNVTGRRVGPNVKDGMEDWVIIVIVIVLLILIICLICFIRFKTGCVIMKCKKGNRLSKKDSIALQQPLGGRDQERESEYAAVDSLHKGQPSEEPLIYAQLGPGGGRTGQRPVVQESLYATAKTDGVHYPDLQKSHHRPIVGSMKPSVSSEDSQTGIVV